MSITAMKQALEALEYGDKAVFAMNLEGVKTKLRQAIEQFEKQKPVAEIREDMKGGGYIEWLDDTYFVPGTKFYTQPQQTEKQEPVAFPALPELPVHARLYYTGSPLRRYKRASVRNGPGESLVMVSVAIEYMQRRDAEIRAMYCTRPKPVAHWVGLTPADFDWLEQVFANKVSNDFVFADIVCVISAKLKEKNGSNT